MNCRVPVAKLRQRRRSDLSVDKLTLCLALQALAPLQPARAMTESDPKWILPYLPGGEVRPFVDVIQ